MLIPPDLPNWQHILWREWRNCGNSAYAKQLFELLADAPVGWGTRTSYIILDAIIGLVLSVIVAFIWTTDGDILLQLAWAGGVVGAARGFIAARTLTWRSWLERLAFGLPARQPSSGLMALVGFMVVGGVIFGPFLWLFLIGLFWGMSGLIRWMMQGLTLAKPFDYQAWYVWWRKRPSRDQVSQALESAYQATQQYPTPTLPEAVLNAPPVEIDFLQLKHYAKNRDTSPRFK